MADSWDRSGRAREVLHGLVGDYGPQVLSNPQLLRNLLGDKLPGSPREASLLVSAAETGIPTSLRQHLDQGIPADVAVRQAVAAFEQRRAYDAAACWWVVSELARALGHPVEEATATPPAPAPTHATATTPAPAPAGAPAPVPMDEGHDGAAWLRGHWWALVAAAGAVVVVLLAVLLTRGGGTSRNAASGSSSSTTTTAPATSTAPPTTAPDLGAYVGEWHVHGVSVIINADGTGSAVWRVYKWCSDSPPPCDQQNGNEIVNGGHAVFRLTAATGSDATGEASQSTDPQAVPNGQLLVKLLPGDHMSFANFEAQLCGPRSDPNTCGA